MRVAQLVLERIYIPEVTEVSDLEDTERGAGGFGSTGEGKVAGNQENKDQERASKKPKNTP